MEIEINFQNAFEVEIAEKFFVPEGRKINARKEACVGVALNVRIRAQMIRPGDMKRGRGKSCDDALSRAFASALSLIRYEYLRERLPAADENKIRLAGFCSYPHRQSEPADIYEIAQLILIKVFVAGEKRLMLLTFLSYTARGLFDVIRHFQYHPNNWQSYENPYLKYAMSHLFSIFYYQISTWEGGGGEVKFYSMKVMDV